MSKDGFSLDWSPEMNLFINTIENAPKGVAKRVRQLNIDTLGDMHNMAFKRAAFDSGFMRDHFFTELDPDGLGGKLYGSAEYTPYVEYGTINSPAQPAIRYAFTYYKLRYVQELIKLVGREFTGGVSGNL